MTRWYSLPNERLGFWRTVDHWMGVQLISGAAGLLLMVGGMLLAGFFCFVPALRGWSFLLFWVSWLIPLLLVAPRYMLLSVVPVLGVGILVGLHREHWWCWPACAGLLLIAVILGLRYVRWNAKDRAARKHRHEYTDPE